jgi:hypothetical protein
MKTFSNPSAINLNEAFTQQNSDNERDYEVFHDFTDKLCYVSYGPLGTPSEYVFWYDGSKIYYYNF